MTDNNGKVRPFGIKDKLGYMFGDFGNDFTFLLSAMFLLKFYTDVMGVSAALVGLMMMVRLLVIQQLQHLILRLLTESTM